MMKTYLLVYLIYLCFGQLDRMRHVFMGTAAQHIEKRLEYWKWTSSMPWATLAVISALAIHAFSIAMLIMMVLGVIQ